MNTMPLDLGRLNVRPLVERDSLTCVEDILLSPDAPPRPVRNSSSTRSASAPHRFSRQGRTEQG